MKATTVDTPFLETFHAQKSEHDIDDRPIVAVRIHFDVMSHVTVSEACRCFGDVHYK